MTKVLTIFATKGDKILTTEVSELRIEPYIIILLISKYA